MRDPWIGELFGMRQMLSLSRSVVKKLVAKGRTKSEDCYESVGKGFSWTVG